MHEPEGMDQLTAHLDRGWDLVAERDWARVRISSGAVLALEPDHPEGLTLLGLAELNGGDPEAALEAFEAARESDPEFLAPILYGAEVIARDPERLDEALARLDEAYALLEPHSPDLPEVVLLHTELLLDAGRVEAARRPLKRLLPAEVEERGLRVQLARVALDLDEDALAEALLAPLLQENDLPSEAVYALAQLAERRKSHAEAAGLYLRVLDLDAENLDAASLPEAAEVEALALAAIGRLPDRLRVLVENAELRVRDLPAEELVADGVDPWSPLVLAAPPALPEAPDDPGVPIRVFHLFLYRANLGLEGADTETRVSLLEEQLVEALERFGA